MAETNTSGFAFTGNVLRDGLRLVQSFTTGGTAQSVQTTAISPSTLAGLSGVVSLGAGDGARFYFYATAGATSITAKLTLFEPVIGSGGGIEAYIEVPIMVTAATLSKTGTAITAGTALNSAISGLPAAAEVIDTISSYAAHHMGVGVTGIIDGDTGPAGPMFVANPAASGGVAFIDYRPAFGASHIRVLLSCATAAKTVSCLAKRLQGASQSLRC